MSKRRKHASNHEDFIAWCRGCNHVARNEQRHEAKQQWLAFKTTSQSGQDRSAEGNAKRINADDQSGEWKSDM